MTNFYGYLTDVIICFMLSDSQVAKCYVIYFLYSCLITQLDISDYKLHIFIALLFILELQKIKCPKMFSSYRILRFYRMCIKISFKFFICFKFLFDLKIKSPISIIFLKLNEMQRYVSFAILLQFSFILSCTKAYFHLYVYFYR